MRCAFAACVVLVAAGPAAADDYPHVYLKNDKLKVKVYLPDAKKGFYRGTRFDWAGVCGEVEFAGHKVFGPWKDTRDPTNHDDILGPCEEFGMERPLGYDDAKPGETFLKIGVGELEKPKEERYSFAGKYKIVKPAEWEEGPNGAEGNVERLFAQVGEPARVWKTTASLPSGHGYTYYKCVQLAEGDPSLVISHLLRNTGSKPLRTDFYNHNFFNVDGDPVGPGYRFVFPFEPRAKELRGRWGELVEAGGRELRFRKPLADGFVMAGLEGFEAKNDDHQQFEFRHGPSGVRVSVSYTYRLSKMNVWGVKTTICPEPFRQIDLPPGRLSAWSISYRFEQDPPKK